jgi:protein TonB
VSKSAPAKRQLTVVVAVIAIGFVVVAGGLGLRSILGQKVDPPKQLVQEVRIVRPPPPPDEPPPPPPPEEQVDVPEPQDQPAPTDESNEPPPGEQLGIDAEGTGAGDGFGLLGRPGGRDLLSTGGSAFSWYGGIVKDEILGRLEDDPKVRSGGYTVGVRLWIGNEGQVERVTLVGSTGDIERDRAIERALAQLTRLSKPPPAGLPQPLTLRIVSRA